MKCSGEIFDGLEYLLQRPWFDRVMAWDDEKVFVVGWEPVLSFLSRSTTLFNDGSSRNLEVAQRGPRRDEYIASTFADAAEMVRWPCLGERSREGGRDA